MSDNSETELEISETVTSIWCNNKWHSLGDTLTPNPNSPALEEIRVGDKEGVLIAQLFYSDKSVTVVPWHQVQAFHVEKG